MHEAMKEQRRSVEDELERMRAITSRQAAQNRQAEIAQSRSWAWPLYNQVDLLEMMHGRR